VGTRGGKGSEPLFTWLMLQTGATTSFMPGGVCQGGQMSIEPVDLDHKLSLFTELWSPKVVALLNDYEVKGVKVCGEFVWHQHDDTDELFLVLHGRLRIDLRDGSVELARVSSTSCRRASSTGLWRRRRPTPCCSSRGGWATPATPGAS